MHIDLPEVIFCTKKQYMAYVLYSEICCGFCYDYCYLCLTNLTWGFTIATLHEGREEEIISGTIQIRTFRRKTRAMRIADITIEPDDILKQVAVTHERLTTTDIR